MKVVRRIQRKNYILKHYKYTNHWGDEKNLMEVTKKLPRKAVVYPVLAPIDDFCLFPLHTYQTILKNFIYTYAEKEE